MRVVLYAAAAAMVVMAAGSDAEARRYKGQTRDSSSDGFAVTASEPKTKNFWDDADDTPLRRSRSGRVARAVSNDSFDDEAPQRRGRSGRSARNVSADSYDHETPHSSVAGVGPRPGAWCGWYMRTRHGGGPEMNLAANWRRYGSPASPQVGAIVVWNHHVGEITGQAANGQWIVLSGNDSGRVRERARSIAGASIRM